VILVSEVRYRVQFPEQIGQPRYSSISPPPLRYPLTIRPTTRSWNHHLKKHIQREMSFKKTSRARDSDQNLTHWQDAARGHCSSCGHLDYPAQQGKANPPPFRNAGIVLIKKFYKRIPISIGIMQWRGFHIPRECCYNPVLSQVLMALHRVPALRYHRAHARCQKIAGGISR